MSKKLSWVGQVCYPGKEPFEIGNLITYDFDPVYVRAEMMKWILQMLPDEFELKGFRRGKLIFKEDV